jgi:integrase
VKLLRFFGTKPWDECNLIAVEEYRVWRATIPNQVSGVKGIRQVVASTRNRELASAQGCFSWAVKRGLIRCNPMAGMSREPESNGDRDFAVPKADVDKILKYAPPRLRQFLLVLYGTGMRRGEALSLEWSEVDLDGGFINLSKLKTKTAKDRSFVMSTNVRAILEMIPRDGFNPWVFPAPHRCNEPINHATMSGWWRKARDAAGVTGPKGQPIWLHSLRHTFATDMVVAGMPVEIVMAICGWSSPAMMHRYVNIHRRHQEMARAFLDARDAEGPSMLGPGVRPRRAPAPASQPTEMQLPGAEEMRR